MRIMDLTNQSDRKRYEMLVRLGNRMRNLDKRKAATQSEVERTSIDEQRNNAQKQIYELLYSLYHLSPESLSYVEKGHV